MTQQIDPVEIYRAVCAAQLEEYKQRKADSHELMKGTLHLSGWALKAVFLANGAAAITSLTFVSSVKIATAINPSSVASAVPCFAYGVAMSVVAGMLAYVAQYYITEANSQVPMSYSKLEPDKPLPSTFIILPSVARWTHVIAVISTIASLVFFVWGMRIAAG